MADSNEHLLSRIEDASLNASAPRQQLWMDGWILRYCPGKARRSRCVNAVATGRLPLAQKLKGAKNLYDRENLPMVFRVTCFTQPAELDDKLDHMGWTKVDSTHVQFKRDLGSVAQSSLPSGTQWVRLPAPQFAEAVGELRNSSPEHRRAHADRLLVSPIPYAGYAIRRDSDGAVLACGQIAQEGELVGLYDVQTCKTLRGQG